MSKIQHYLSKISFTDIQIYCFDFYQNEISIDFFHITSRKNRQFNTEKSLKL